MTTRNTNARFELAPQVDTERSTFSMDCNIKTSFNVGELIPFYCLEVLPGDTFEIETSKVARLQTLLTPVMDNLYLDTYYFFVPNRLVWKHWKNLMGESERAWYPANQYTVPQIKAATTNGTSLTNKGTLWDYFGLPVDKNSIQVNALPFRAYAKIVDDWFRDENLEDPIYIPDGDSTVTALDYGTVVNSTNLYQGGKPYIVSKYHDYFTSCLPSPQKGPEVTFLAGYAPVVTSFDDNPETSFPDDGVYAPMLYKKASDFSDIDNAHVLLMDKLYQKGTATYNTATASVNTDADGIMPSNLVANLGFPSTGYYSQENTINSLRHAFQIQRMLERDARGGSRYIELIRSHFGITSPDARLQRAEYLGGNRVPLNIEQVTQTSSTDSTSPIGYQAGWSQTNDTNYDVNKSFTEHGFILGLMVARYDHTYQDGINRMWSRKTRYDYYWPALAHLGEQAVKNKEIFYNDAVANRNEDVFGYQEAWAEYRYMPNYVTGLMRAGITNSLAIWNFADKYSTLPFLSRDWMKEDKTNVDRTLAVTSSVSNQIIIDILVNNRATRPMPLYSIPGLIDHF